MEVHLVDGTYELFRHWFALPGRLNDRGQEIDAARGVVGSLLSLLERGATHVGVATDHVVESFRNDLWDGYKNGDGIEPELFEQFPVLEGALRAFGFTVWPMVEFEADDGLASAAAVASADPRVARVLICTADKDLGQCVGGKVVQWDRRKDVVLDSDAIVAKFGVPPSAIADYLALVGDAADGFPGLPGWGAKSAATVLARYGSIDAIPEDARAWDVNVRGAAKLANTLGSARDELEVFRKLARLVVSAPVGVVDDWVWTGPQDDLDEWAECIVGPRFAVRARALAATRLG